MELIRIIAEQRPTSIAELSEKTGRAPSNLSRTLHRLASYGFVALKRRPGNVVRPIARAVEQTRMIGQDLATRCSAGYGHPLRSGRLRVDRARVQSLTVGRCCHQFTTDGGRYGLHA